MGVNPVALYTVVQSGTENGEGNGLLLSVSPVDRLQGLLLPPAVDPLIEVVDRFVAGVCAGVCAFAALSTGETTATL